MCPFVWLRWPSHFQVTICLCAHDWYSSLCHKTANDQKRKRGENDTHVTLVKTNEDEKGIIKQHTTSSKAGQSLWCMGCVLWACGLFWILSVAAVLSLCGAVMAALLLWFSHLWGAVPAWTQQVPCCQNVLISCTPFWGHDAGGKCCGKDHVWGERVNLCAIIGFHSMACPFLSLWCH